MCFWIIWYFGHAQFIVRIETKDLLTSTCSCGHLYGSFRGEFEVPFASAVLHQQPKVCRCWLKWSDVRSMWGKRWTKDARTISFPVIFTLCNFMYILYFVMFIIYLNPPRVWKFEPQKNTRKKDRGPGLKIWHPNGGSRCRRSDLFCQSLCFSQTNAPIVRIQMGSVH